MLDVSCAQGEPGPFGIGEFVAVDGQIGKLLELTGDVARIEFFDAPVASGLKVVEVDGARVKPAVVEPQTRCWWNDQGRWKAGRVHRPPDSDSEDFLVAFPDNEGRILSSSDIYIRWSRPLDDPVRLLIGGISDSRYFQRARRGFMREMLGQHAAAAGLTSILSSSIELHPHQVGAARRVLLDTTRRYLLADEVGLGKTIEAGVVIRQTLIDVPTSSVLAIVPDELVHQWDAELRSKFHVADFHQGVVDVRPHSALAGSEFPPRVDLIVVDEAHRLTASGADEVSYDALAGLAHRSEALLLLTATPVRSNEDSFLRLLHLLDPQTYRLDDFEGFRHRVEQRDEIANAITMLSSDAPLFLLSSASASLRGVLDGDLVLDEILNELDAAVDVADAEAARLSADRLTRYVSERYRLHHRMIRTRRTGSQAEAFPVRGRKRPDHWQLADPSPTRPAFVEALDRFRLALASIEEASRSSILRFVAERCSAADPAIGGLVDAVLHDSADDLHDEESTVVRWLRGSEDGVALALELKATLDARPPESPSRVGEAASWAWNHVGKAKVAACTNYTSVGRALYDEMSRRYGSHRVAGLLSDLSETELVSEYERATEDDQCTLLVCDRVSEEGWNLQRFEEVLHLDLPWSTNRLEQRLGRFDRWVNAGTSSRAVTSTVFRDVAGLDEITGSWTRLVAEGFGVFDASTASLQYVLPEREERAVERALLEGFESVAADVVAEREAIERERKTIQGQDLLDSTELSDDEAEFFNQLLACDRRADRHGRAVTEWLKGAIRLTMSDGPPWRFGVSQRNPPLIPNQQVQSLGMHHLRSKFVVERDQAVDLGMPILRAGNGLLDGVFALCEADDRGLAFVGYAKVPNLPSDSPVIPLFHFDFVVGPDLEHLGLPQGPSGLSLKRRAKLLFPPVLASIWWIPGHGEPPEHVSNLAEGNATENLWNAPGLFTDLRSQFDWDAVCRQAEHEAGRAVLSQQAISQATATSARRLERWRSDRTLSKVLRADDPSAWDETLDSDIDEIAQTQRNLVPTVMSSSVAFLGPVRRGT